MLSQASPRVEFPLGTGKSKDAALADAKKRLGRNVLYARVSTADQTLVHQHSQAEAAGFH
jgi:predicted site-specific integrase-resolvase